MIYVIGTGSPSAKGNFVVKIGTSANPEQRLKQINAHSPTPMRLLMVTEGDRARETGLHREFAKYRQHGEWFTLPRDELVRLIGIFGGDPYSRPIAQQMEAKSRAMKRNREQIKSMGHAAWAEAKRVEREKRRAEPTWPRALARKDRRAGAATTMIVVTKLGRGPCNDQLWGFSCPGCAFPPMHERTSPQTAVAWARQHNDAAHGNKYEIHDLTGSA